VILTHTDLAHIWVFAVLVFLPLAYLLVLAIVHSYASSDLSQDLRFLCCLLLVVVVDFLSKASVNCGNGMVIFQ
jgi:hypothetical protein